MLFKSCHSSEMSRSVGWTDIFNAPWCGTGTSTGKAGSYFGDVTSGNVSGQGVGARNRGLVLPSSSYAFSRQLVGQSR